MARLSLSSLTLALSRAYDVIFRLFWIFLTFLVLTLVWPAVRAANSLRFQDHITDLERLVYDVSSTWYVPILGLCMVLSVGCVVGFFPNSKLRKTCTRIIVYQMFILFICDAYACYLTYNILQSRGFEIIGKACQANKPKDLSEAPLSQFEEFCHDIEFGAKYVALVALVVWKLVGLNIIVLTWIWHMCAAKQQPRLEKTIGEEVHDGAGQVKLTGEDTLNVEQKV